MSDNTPPQKPLKTLKHLRSIDALRGIAVLGVVFVHTSLFCQLQGVYAELGHAGQRGVQLFYIVSAFTIFYSLDSRKKDEQHPIRNFFIRRFFRIAPLFYFAIILNLLFGGNPLFADNLSVLTPFNILLGFLFLNSFKPSAINAVALGGWSIAIEFVFYATAPFLFRYIKNFNKAFGVVVVGSIAMYIITHFVASHADPKYAEYFCFLSFPIEFPVFCMGMLAYIVWKNDSSQLETLINMSRKTISLVLLGVCAFILFFSFPFTTNNLHLTSFGFIFLLLALTFYEWPLFVNRVTTFLGKISFSVYLMHFFVIMAFDWFFKHYQPDLYHYMMGRRLPFVIMYVIITFVSAIVSYVTFKLIETPGMNLGKKIIALQNKP